MAIDPPYRLDPFRNLINIQWRKEEETTSGTGVLKAYVNITLSTDTYWLNYDIPNNIYGSAEIHPPFQEDSQLIGQFTISSQDNPHPPGPRIVVVDANSIHWSGFTLTGTYIAYNALEPHDSYVMGTYTYDFSGFAPVYGYNDPPTIVRPKRPYEAPYQIGDELPGWATGMFVFEPD